MAMFGRRIIYTDEENINSGNVIDVLTGALNTHNLNRPEIEYLYEYYKGNQPILQREKDIRPEICNRIVENRANQIVSFKVGYLLSEPVQYVNRDGRDDISESVKTLNDYMFFENKSAKDTEIVEWFSICGTSYRIVLPKMEDDDCPIRFYTLDPRNSFVVYSSGIDKRPMMGVTYVDTNDGVVYTVYTKDYIFDILDARKIRSVAPNYIGDIPIIEYFGNNARLGEFEIVITMLDELNKICSNRVDGIEQFVQALLVVKGVAADEEALETIIQQMGLVLPADGDAKYLVQELNQTQIQTLVDYTYQTILTICGMPNRNGGTSTSDTGKAVILRDGFTDAETRAKKVEELFKASEKQFIKLVLSILDGVNKSLGIKAYDVSVKLPRGNYENMLEKVQVLIELLNNDKVAPIVAYQTPNLFSDPDKACALGMEFYEKRTKEEETALKKDFDEYVRNNGQGNAESDGEDDTSLPED